MQAAAASALATVLAAAGRCAEADDLFARAIELHEGKGDRIGAERIQALRRDASEERDSDPRPPA